METETIKLLKEWATTYHCSSFIPDDPVQFPHRYVEQKDIEISGLLTAVLSFGNRKMILRKADELDVIMGHSPLEYILSGKWRDDFRISVLTTRVVSTGWCLIPTSVFILKNFIPSIPKEKLWKTGYWNMPEHLCRNYARFLRCPTVRLRKS